MQTWIPDIYVDLVGIFMKFIEMYGKFCECISEI